MLEYFTEKLHHALLLLLWPFPLQSLLKVAQLEDIPASHFCKLDLVKRFFDKLLECIAPARVLAEDVDDWRLFEELSQYVLLEGIDACSDFFHVPAEIDFSEIGAEGIVALSNRPNERVKFLCL